MTSCNSKCNMHYASFWSNPPYFRTDISLVTKCRVFILFYTRCSLDQMLKSPERPDDVIILISKTESVLHL